MMFYGFDDYYAKVQNILETAKFFTRKNTRFYTVFPTFLTRLSWHSHNTLVAGLDLDAETMNDSFTVSLTNERPLVPTSTS